VRIAMATWSYDEHQGISRCVVELSLRLAAEHEVHIFAANVAAAPRDGVQVHRVPLRFPQVHVNEYDFALRAGRAIRRGGFDLVHAHFPVWCATDVYTCHGLARMALRSFRAFPSAPRMDVSMRRMARWYAQVPLHTQALRRAGSVLAAVSRRVAREVAEDSGRALSQIDVVPNGADLASFHPSVAATLREPTRRELGYGSDRFVLLWVGNHLRHKGLRHALDTMLRLPSRATLLVVGADAPDSVPELRPQISALQRAGRIRFLPAESRIERCYSAADALLFPSLYESFGLVVLEAMAMGLPVVTARTVAFADEAMHDGVNGFVVDHPWQCQEMAERVARLMDDAGLSNAVAAAARRTAEAYSWDTYSQHYLQLYRKAAGQRYAVQGPVRAA
jgi:UDP-glucose:(heptosyl)LPS alpha-1,3-glucosyltransferase